jgi:dephospho-CoA kinase
VITVGITGGIGSGKSLVCRIFSTLGIPVYTADKRASEIMETNEEVREALVRLLGKEVYTGKMLNRKVMSALIFNRTQYLQGVNEIVHPAVLSDFQEWKMMQEETPYVIHEAAILFESGAYTFMDVVMTVYAPVKIRIRRIMERDGLTMEEIKARMRQQWNEKQRQEKADVVIRNDEKQLILPHILSLHRFLTKAYT